MSARRLTSNNLDVNYNIVASPLYSGCRYSRTGIEKNDDDDTTIYKAPQHVHEVNTRAPYIWFTRWMQNSARRPPTLGPSPRTWAIGPPLGNYIHHRRHYYSARKLILILPSHVLYVGRKGRRNVRKGNFPGERRCPRGICPEGYVRLPFRVFCTCGTKSTNTDINKPNNIDLYTNYSPAIADAVLLNITSACDWNSGRAYHNGRHTSALHARGICNEMIKLLHGSPRPPTHDVINDVRFSNWQAVGVLWHRHY